MSYTPLNANDAGTTSRTTINANFGSIDTQLATKVEFTGTVPADGDLTVFSGATGKVLKKKVFTASQVLESDSNGQPTSAAKGTAYNKNFGNTTDTVLQGDVAGTSGTAVTTSNKLVDNADSRLSASGRVDDYSIPAGEAITAGQAVFVEIAPTYANSTSVRNIADTSATTRLSFPVFGSGVAGTTFKIALKKTSSPSATFSFRIETDNAGSPSGTLAHANASGTLAAGSITTSFVDTTLTLAGSVTLTSGTRYHLVLFSGTYGSETVNASNYYNIGYCSASTHTTTRPSKAWNGSVWSAAENTTFCYTSSTLFTDGILSLTDADYSYKVNLYYGLASETKAVGLFPKITISGVNNQQLGLTVGSVYYLSGTPGAISTTQGTNGIAIGTAISGTSIRLFYGQTGTTLLLNSTSTVSITASGQTIYSFTLPANTLLANKKLVARFNYNGGNSGGSLSCNITMNIGGASPIAQIQTSKLGTNASISGFGELLAYGLTASTQFGDGKLTYKTTSNGDTVWISYADYATSTSAINCAIDQTVTIVATGTFTGFAPIIFTRCTAWVE